MKKLIALLLLLSSAALINGATWQEMLQGASNQPAVQTAPTSNSSPSWLEMIMGQPATKPAASPAPEAKTGTSWLEMVTGQSVADRPAATPAAAQTTLSQLTTAIPTLIANIKLIAPKALEIATQYSKGGWLSGLSSVGSMDTATRTAFIDVITKARAVSNYATSLLANADAATKSTVQGLLAQLVAVPEFKSLLDSAKNIPIIGSQLDGYLKSLTAQSVK